MTKFRIIIPVLVLLALLCACAPTSNVEISPRPTTSEPTVSPTLPPSPYASPTNSPEPDFITIGGHQYGKDTKRLFFGELDGAITSEDIEQLRYLTQLEELAITGKGISDISALAGLNNLKLLALSDNNISDISALSGLGNLRLDN